MALYKDGRFLTQTPNDGDFDTLHTPGVATPYSGIYRCTGCGREVTSVYSHPLPTQNHHEHAAGQGLIRWHLVVYADHRPH